MPPQPTRATFGRAALAWIGFDFGYTMFAYVVFARYLSDWLITDLHQPDWVYTSGQVVAAALLLSLLPLLGAVADALGSHRQLLAICALVSAGAGGLISFVRPDLPVIGVLGVLGLGVVCAVGAGLAYSQFDPMLGDVAPERSWETVSAFGVMAGFVGISLWLALLGNVIVGEGDKQGAFAPAAAIFAVCALPLLLTRPPFEDHDGRTRLTVGLVRDVASSRVSSVVRRIRRQPAVLRLLVGRLLYADAIGTVNIFAAVYMSRVGGFSERDKSHVTLVVVAAAAIGAIVAGALARRFGPKRTLASIIPLFALALVVTAVEGSPRSVWLLAPVLGISLGTIYTVDRLFMLVLAPPERRGEIFGVFNLIGRVGQALGPFVLWGGVIFVLHDASGWIGALAASRVALGLIALAALAGLAVILPLDDGHAQRRGVHDRSGG